jgi:hypothetical protein
MRKLLGFVFFVFAGLTIYDGNAFLGNVGLHLEGYDRYFYAIPNVLIGLIILFTDEPKDPEVYSCKKCDDAFWETDLKNGMCPICGKEVKNINSKVSRHLEI